MFNSEEYKKGFMDGVKYAEKNRKPIVHTAHWIKEKFDKTHYNYYCDHCNFKSKFHKSKFCPGCGYMMVEDKS